MGKQSLSLSFLSLYNPLQLGVRGTYLKYHDPKRPLQGGDPGVNTINQSQPHGDLGKDIPGRGTNYCKGPGAGASLVGLKGRKKV